MTKRAFVLVLLIALTATVPNHATVPGAHPVSRSAMAIDTRLAATGQVTQVTDAPRVPVLLVTGGQASTPLVLEAARYEVTVTGIVARTRATLTFRNDASRVLEGELVYPLPEGAALSGFALDVGGRMVDGVVVETRQARIAFETEVRRGVDPGLAEVVRGNTFRTRVWPLPARGRRVVRLEYVHELPERVDGGASTAFYELPLRFNAPLEDFSLRAEVVRGDAAPVVRSGPANFAFARWQDRYVAETSARDVTPQDLVIALPRVDGENVLVETEANGDTFFVIDDFPVMPAPGPVGTARPSRIAVFWDASLSREPADRERELKLLESHLAQLRDVEVVAVVFRNTVEASRSFAIRGGDTRALIEALRAAPRDGATNLRALSFPADVAYSLLFTDGQWTVGGSPAFSATRPVFVVSSSSEADHGLLSALAGASGGAYFSLLRHTEADVLSRVGQPVFSLLEVSADGGIADAEPRAPQPVSGRVTIAGRLTSPVATVRLRYGVRPDGPVRTTTYELRRREGRSTGMAARRWAERRIASLSIEPEANRAQLVELGRKHSIVTPGTSLLVLETLEQYVEHGVTPPESLPDVRRAYEQRVAETGRVKVAKRAEKADRVAAMWARRVEWWQRRFEYQQGFRYKEPAASRVGAGEGVAGAVPPPPSAPPPPAPAARAAEAPNVSAAAPTVQTSTARGQAEEARAEDAAPAGPTIAVAPWNPDTPYLRALAGAAEKDAYDVYLAQRKEFGTSPAFFLDCADFFARRGARELALRVLTSVAELKLEDARLLRVLAHRLEQIDALDLAVELFEQVRRLRDEEPQSHRDLALALDRRAARRQASAATPLPDALADQQRALSLLAEVVMGEWDDRFPEVEVLALEEANRIAAVLERRGARVDWPLDTRLRQLLDVDVRVVLTWDTDLTDMDLWVTEPSGERCFYGHALTTIGGSISRDFTGGLGPEVYAVRRAMAGDYRVQANFFGSRAQTLTGPTTVQAVVYTDYGRPDEGRRAVTLRLTEARDVVDVATVSFKARTVTR